jgi:membrane fusion protein, heavy metal efflux system
MVPNKEKCKMKNITNNIIQMRRSFRFMIMCLFILSKSVALAQHDHEGHTHDHEGHSHGEEGAGLEAPNQNPLPTASETSTDKYELLLKFTPVEPGEELAMNLFLSDVNSNVPTDSAALQITNAGFPAQQFQITRLERGMYKVQTIMPDEKLFNLDVTINSTLGPDLIRLQNVDFTHHHIEVTAALDEHEHSHLWMYLSAVAILLVGFLLGRMMSQNKLRKQAIGIFIAFCLVPTAQWNLATAHEGEDHGPKKKENNLSASFTVLKESQFLMGVLTQSVGSNAFTNSRRLYGTIIPSSSGMATVSSPQAGRVVSINVAVGQNVKKGQQLAVIERLSDAASEVNFMAERNRVEAEFVMATKEYDRLKSLEDIAAKKQLDEAKGRLDIATRNRELYQSGGAKNIVLKAPIDGLVSAFTLSAGTSVNAEQSLFTIVNLSTVYIEAQAFEKDVELLTIAKKFTAQCTEENHTCESVTLLSIGQDFNPSNQSQRVLFEVENHHNEFKLGEFVNVFAFANESENTIAIANSAITELEGRPVVFIKNSAEQYELRYVAVGADNGLQTIITSGISSGDKVVVAGAYQVKLIYMNH